MAISIFGLVILLVGVVVLGAIVGMGLMLFGGKNQNNDGN